MRVLFLSLLLMACTALHAADPKPPFTLAIVPSSSQPEAGEISMADKKPNTFHVVLTNISPEPQPVWRTSNSWGFWTIAFEFIMPDGKRYSVTKNKNECFTVNYPGTFLIPTGEQEVYPIQLDTEWDNRPKFSEKGLTPVQVKAIYEVHPTPESKQYKVWTGRIESRTYRLSLNHW